MDSPVTPGTIIILNGASSSGKSSLLAALQQRLDEPFLDLGIDKIIFSLPPRFLERPEWDEVLGRAVEAGPLGMRLFSGMHRAIRSFALSGVNVLADHVLVHEYWLAECALLFAPLNAYLIGVGCPLETLEDRERSRPSRTPGQARAQFGLVHAHAVYDLEVNTALHTPDGCARRVIKRLAEPPEAFRLLAGRYERGV